METKWADRSREDCPSGLASCLSLERLQGSAFDNRNILKALRNTHMQLTYRYSATHYMPLPCLYAHAHSTRAGCSLQLTVTVLRGKLCIVDPGAVA